MKTFPIFLLTAVFILLLGLSFTNKRPNGLALPLVKTAAPTPTLSPWITYSNDHYNYSINYPRGWQKSEWEFHEATQLNLNRGPQEGMIWQQASFTGKDQSFQILIWVNRQKAAIPQWLRWYRHEDLDLGKIPQKSNYQVLGKEAYLMLSEKTSWGYPVVRIFFTHDDHIFEMVAQSPSENLDKIYREMIASFQLKSEEQMSCPKVKIVNCMPVVSGENINFCQKTSQEWISQNCPGVKFID